MAIEQLTPFQHMQSRPDMYISQTQTPIHLLYELIDNASDECITGNANKIVVSLNYDKHEYAVSDNGRGIPIKSPKIDGECPIIIATTLYSGGKFDNDLYSYHSGLHGVGLAVVNALSDTMTIITKNKDKSRKYVFNNSDSQDIIPEDVELQKFSTRTSFIPSSKYFDSVDIDSDVVIERLKGILLSSDDIGITLVTIKDGKSNVIQIDNDLLDSFNNSVSNSIEVKLKGTKEGSKISDVIVMHIGFSEDIKASKFFSVVNTLPISDGVHKRFIENAIMNYAYSRAEKLKKHVEKKDMLLGSNVFAIVSLSDPAFAGQMKYSLAGKNDRYAHVFDTDKLIKAFDKNKEFFDKWIDMVEKYRMELDSTRKIKTKSNRNKVSVEDLKDCTSKNISERELYILEGQSAGGTLLKCRDVKRHAILPLRGKILNVINSSFGKIVESQTLSKIFNTIGIKPNDLDPSNIRYQKIIIAADADEDGKHISALLLSFFDKFCPILIDEGRLFVSEMPLFGVHIKGKFIPIFDEESLEQYKATDIVIHRYKGLGEMDPDELAPCMFDDNTRRLIQVTRSPEGSVEAVWEDKNSIVEDYLLE